MPEELTAQEFRFQPNCSSVGGTDGGKWHHPPPTPTGGADSERRAAEFTQQAADGRVKVPA